MISYFRHICPFVVVDKKLNLNPSFLVIFSIAIFYLTYNSLKNINWIVYAFAILSLISIISLFFSASRLIAIIILLLIIILQSKNIFYYFYSNNYHDNPINEISGKILKYSNGKIDLINTKSYFNDSIKNLSFVQVTFSEEHEVFNKFFPVGWNVNFYNLETSSPQKNKIYIYNSKSSYKLFNSRTKYNYFNKFKNYIRLLIDSISSQPELGIIKSLIIYDRTTLDNKLKNKIIKLGIFHLISISGLHLIQLFITIKLLLLIFLKFVRLHLNTAIAEICSILNCLVYVILINFPIPTVRALIFLTIYLLIKYFFNHINIRFKIFFIALIMIIYDPSVIGSVSFNLSFIAVLGISFVYQHTINLKLFRNNNLNHLFNYFVYIFVGSFIISLYTLPIIIYFFNNLNFLLPINNIIHIPIVTFLIIPIIFISLVIFILSYIFPILTNLSLFWVEIINYIFLIWNKIISVNFNLTKNLIISNFNINLSNTILIWVFAIFLIETLFDFKQSKRIFKKVNE